MSRRPRVSVVVPAKDAEPYVADTIASLVRQLDAFDDPRDLEVVVVDDGSRDGTGDVVADVAARLPRLQVLRNETPTGLASARNQGRAAASGRYVAFLDADDWLAPGHLAHLAGALDTLACDFVRVDHTTVEGRKRVVRRAPQGRRGIVLDPRDSILPPHESTMVDYPYAWAGLFDAALADDGLLTFPDGLHTAEDRPWIWALHLRARAYAVVDAPGVLYRRGVTTSLTQVVDRRQLDFVAAFTQCEQVLAADPEAARFRPKLVRTVLAISARHLERGVRMAPELGAELSAGVRGLLSLFPSDVVAEQLRAASPERRLLLEPVT